MTELRANQMSRLRRTSAECQIGVKLSTAMRQMRQIVLRLNLALLRTNLKAWQASTLAAALGCTGDYMCVLRALLQLGKVGEYYCAQHTKSVVAVLQTKHVLVRTAAITLLGRLGRTSVRYISELIDRLQDGNSLCRRLVVEALGKILEYCDGRSKDHLSALLPLLRDQDLDVQFSTLRVLAQFPHHAAAHAGDIISTSLVDENRENVKKSAISTLQQFWPNSLAPHEKKLSSIPEGECLIEAIRMWKLRMMAWAISHRHSSMGVQNLCQHLLRDIAVAMH